MKTLIASDLSQLWYDGSAPCSKLSSWHRLPGELRNMIYEFAHSPSTMSNGSLSYKGTTHILHLCRKTYNESRHLLHDIPQSLRLPLSPDAPLFRHAATRFRRDKKRDKSRRWETALSTREPFTAVEFRRLSYVTLEIEYLAEGSTRDFAPSFLKQMEYARRVLGGSLALQTICLQLSAAGSDTPLFNGGEHVEQMPSDLDEIKTLLVPWVKLGKEGGFPHMYAENKFGVYDRVVEWFNETRTLIESVWSQKTDRSNVSSVATIAEIASRPPFPPGFVFHSALERRALQDKTEPIILDVRRLFDPEKYLPSKPKMRRALFKCFECLMVFENKKLLQEHRHLSYHYSTSFFKPGSRNHCPGGTADYFCGHQCNGPNERHFIQTPYSAYRCPTCLSKFDNLEGIQTHMEYWKHGAYDPHNDFDDNVFSSELNSPVYKCPTSQYYVKEGGGAPYPPFSCGTCWAAFNTARDLIAHFREESHIDEWIPGGEGLFALGRVLDPERPLHRCRQCHGYFETQACLENHVKTMNASRYAERGHFIHIHHPSLPRRHPGDIPCPHPKCNRSFPSLTQMRHHLEKLRTHDVYFRRPKRTTLFMKFSQGRLPVENCGRFRCARCKEEFETRNLLQRHLEHRKFGCILMIPVPTNTMDGEGEEIIYYGKKYRKRMRMSERLKNRPRLY